MNIKNFSTKFLLIIYLIFSSTHLFSQVTLNADGARNTYELINSVLAPGANVVENPECIHPEFGRHIAEVWDTDLNQYVFEFYIHVTPDNDRCINFDRQRMEIKTYDASPANLKGTSGETITYKWKFRLPVGFQPSSNFTHLHQIKAVDGDADMPIFTFTARKGTPNKLEIIHNNVTKVASANLSLFEGNWVEATETIKVDSIHGTYSLLIKNIASGATIISYTNPDLMTIRSDNSFIRPKWGIYRSLLSSQDLRDEAVRFNSFSIYEDPKTDLLLSPKSEKNNFKINPNPVSNEVNIEFSLAEQANVQVDICNLNGMIVKILFKKQNQSAGKYFNTFDLSDLLNGIYFARFSSGKFTKTTKLIIKNILS